MCVGSRLEATSQLFKAVDNDNIKNLKQFLTGNPNGWQVRDEVSSHIPLQKHAYVYVVMLRISIYSMNPPCYTMLLAEVAWNVYNI